jgi:hypothetical protein
VGTSDRLVRDLVVAPLAVVPAVVVGAGSVLGVVLLVVAAIMALAAVVGTCPLYRVLGTTPRRRAHT